MDDVTDQLLIRIAKLEAQIAKGDSIVRRAADISAGSIYSLQEVTDTLIYTTDVWRRFRVAEARVAELEAEYSALSKLHEKATERTVQLTEKVAELEAWQKERIEEESSLAEAYGDAIRRAHELASVIERAKSAPPVETFDGGIRQDTVYTVLDMVDTKAALQTIRADAWDDGHRAGWDARNDDAIAGWTPSGAHESDAVNPYRGESEPVTEMFPGTAAALDALTIREDVRLDEHDRAIAAAERERIAVEVESMPLLRRDGYGTLNAPVDIAAAIRG